MTEGAEIVKTAEASGHAFVVHRGAVFIRSAPWADPVERAVFETRKPEAREYLLSTRGADADALGDLWESDAELRREFPTLPDFDDFAHAEGLRLLSHGLCITPLKNTPFDKEKNSETA